MKRISSSCNIILYILHFLLNSFIILVYLVHVLIGFIDQEYITIAEILQL